MNGVMMVGAECCNTDESTSYFVGIQWMKLVQEQLGAAVGTKVVQQKGTDEELMYEAYYSYPVNDGMTITPLSTSRKHNSWN